jgi:hypothetical protein
VDVITRYCEAVETLQRAQEPWPEEQLLICLVARDAISHNLKAGKLHDVALMRQLFAADRALRTLLLRLATVATIPHWRESLQPPANTWWWFPPVTPAARL